MLRERNVDAIIHFAGSVVVPDSVARPLEYYENNTVKSRALIESAVRCGVENFIFSSTAAVYGTPRARARRRGCADAPESPYGSSKLMTEIMLRDAAAAHGFRYTALRYFNVAGADPAMRTGQSTRGATHLIKVACEVATGKRQFIEIYGTDFPTPDGTGVRDYIHVTDLVEAHHMALQRLRAGAPSLVANCGYGRGYSVREVVDAVSEVAGKPIEAREVVRRAGDPAAIVADAARARSEFDWQPAHDDLREIIANALQWEEVLRGRNR